MVLTEPEFKLFKDLVYEESGICLKETRKDFLENRLEKRMRVTGMSSPYWYYKFLLERKKTELLILLDILAIHETSFFRFKPQMDLFGSVLLPQLISRKHSAGSRELKFWSAGCSTGEEPYSVAMALLEGIPTFESWDMRVYASDLSLASLEVASRAEYASDKVLASVPSGLIGKYFERTEGGYRVSDRVRDLVVFDFHNLKHDNGLRGLDVIFCRNVMIYFDLSEQKRLLEKFYESLKPGGYLLLGHSESLHGMNTGFRFVSGKGAGAYRRPFGRECENFSCR